MARGDTGPMNEHKGGLPDPVQIKDEPVQELSHRPDGHTGYQMPDPKDSAQPFYTTTPEGDRVSSANEGKYEPVQMQDPHEVTGQFDHLATRDPEAMEHRLQAPDYAGAQTVAGLTPAGSLDAVTIGSLGVPASLAAAAETRQGAIDPNPGYTPPSEMGPAHLSQRPGDLPQGLSDQAEHTVRGDGDTRR